MAGFCAIATIAATALVTCIGARVAQFSYIGCFIDSSVRDLTGLAGVSSIGNFHTPAQSVTSSEMTHEFCSNICSLGGFPYFSLQASAYCFCGWSYESQGAANETDCNKACFGNSSQMCGAGWRNSVFAQTYPNANLFTASERVNITVTNNTFVTHWNVTASSTFACLIQCNTGCEAVIFSQQLQVCSLLKYALVPTALSGLDGEFYVRY